MGGMRFLSSLLFLSLLVSPAGFAQQADAERRIAAVEALLKQRPEDGTLYFYLARFQCEAGSVPRTIAALENVEKYGDGFLPAEGFEKCQKDADCAAGTFCILALTPHVCKAPQAAGASCKRDVVCASKKCDIPSGKDVGVCK